MAEFILQTSYPSRRIILQTDNSYKYKSEDEFCSIIGLDILRGKRPRNIAKPIPMMGKLRQKPSKFRLDINLETDNPSKTNFPSLNTSSRRAKRRISLRRIFAPQFVLAPNLYKKRVTRLRRIILNWASGIGYHLEILSSQVDLTKKRVNFMPWQ